MQTASGFNVAEGEAFGSQRPKDNLLGASARSYATGFLLAFAVMTVLKRHYDKAARSWHVRLSLAKTGLAGCANSAASTACIAPISKFDDVRDCLEETPSGSGRLTAAPPRRSDV